MLCALKKCFEYHIYSTVRFLHICTIFFITDHCTKRAGENRIKINIPICVCNSFREILCNVISIFKWTMLAQWHNRIAPENYFGWVSSKKENVFLDDFVRILPNRNRCSTPGWVLNKTSLWGELTATADKQQTCKNKKDAFKIKDSNVNLCISFWVFWYLKSQWGQQ